MPKKSVELSNEEYRQVEELKHKLNLTDREIYLKGLGIESKKRKIGRPRLPISDNPKKQRAREYIREYRNARYQGSEQSPIYTVNTTDEKANKDE